MEWLKITEYEMGKVALRTYFKIVRYKIEEVGQEIANCGGLIIWESSIYFEQ